MARVNSRKPLRYFSRFGLIFATLVVLLLAPALASAQPTGYQEYIVLGYEEHIWRAFRAIFDGPDSSVPGSIASTVSLVATADQQKIIYDHWEDGYEPDPFNPTSPTTLVLGDGNTSNGGEGTDVLSAGDGVHLESNENVTGPTAVNGYVPVDPARDPNDLRYDGGDRIFSQGGPLVVTHATWPLGSSWIGGAWEVFSQQAFEGTYSYRLPVGEDLYPFGGGITGSYPDFRNVFLEVVAFEDDTTLLVDDGATRVTVTLAQGQTYSSLGFVDSAPAPAITINAGTRVRSNRAAQVGLITGSDSPESGFQGRFFSLLPDELWGADYVIPMPGAGTEYPAEFYVSNPNEFPITVHAFDNAISTTFTISPSMYISATVPYSTKRHGQGFVPSDSAVRFNSTDGVFGVAVAADTGGLTYDWGFSAIPAKYLTRDYYVSWAPGTTDLSDNGSPVWLTPLTDGTTFFVDFSPVDGLVDETFVLDVLEQQTVFDPDNDNTGTHVWATGEFAAAWGEDPRVASASVPFLDLGVATLSLVQRWLDPVLSLDKTASVTSLPREGGTVTFTLAAQSYTAPLVDVDMADVLPDKWSYVAGSSRVVFPDGAQDQPEPTQDGNRLFWDLSTEMAADQRLILSFQALISDTQGVQASTNRGTAVGRDAALDTVFSPTDEETVYIGPLRLVKSVSKERAEIDDTLVYTLAFSNISTDTVASNLILRDAVPIQHVHFESASDAGVYNPVSGSVVWPLGVLAPGQQGSVSFQVRVNDFAENGTVLRNSAILQGDGTAVVSNETSTLILAPEVQLQKSGPSIAGVGQIVTFTLSYRNDGQGAATGAEIRDHVPEFMQYVPGSLALKEGDNWVSLSDAVDGDAGAFVSPTLVVTPGSLPGKLLAGETGLIRFQTRVAETAPASSFVCNSAVLRRNGGVPRESNTVVTRIVDLALTKAVTPTVVAPGGLISYTLTYRNRSLGVLQSELYLVEPVPQHTRLLPGSVYGADGIEYSADDGQTWGSVLPAGPVTHLRWYDAELPPNAQALAGFTVQVSVTLPPSTTIANQAQISSAETRMYSSGGVLSDEVRVGTVDLWLTKQVSRDSVKPGYPLSYTISYGNRGSIGATGVQIRDRIPDNTVYRPSSIWGAGGSDAGLPYLVWDIGSLPAASGPHTVGYAVTVSQSISAETFITNTAQLASAFGLRSSAMVTSRVAGPYSPLLFLHKEVSPTIVAPGLVLTYSFQMANDGLVAYDVVLSDVLPANTSFVDCTGLACQLLGNTVVWGPLAEFGEGSQLPATLVVKADPDLVDGDLIVNDDYRLTAGNADPQIGGPVTATVRAPALTILKWAAYTQVYAGARLRYEILLSNDGGRANQLVISDSLPAHLSFVGCDCTLASVTTEETGGNDDAQACGAAWECGLEGDVVVWQIGSLESKRAVQLGLWTMVDPQTPDGTFLVNRDYGAAARWVPPLTDNPAVTTTVRQLQVSIQKEAWPNPLAVTETLNFTIHVRNDGEALEGLTVTDALPSGVSFVSCAGGQWCELSPGQRPEVRWWLPALPNGAEESLMFRVTLRDTWRDVVVNDLFGVLIPEANQCVMGVPVQIQVQNPTGVRKYLPITLVDR
jgi:uncharacterized repeat protein (TIGR01451 family)